MDFIHVLDNTDSDGGPRILLQAQHGELLYRADDLPAWLEKALHSVSLL